MARKISYGKPCYQTYQNTQNSLKSGLVFDANFEHPTLCLKGVDAVAAVRALAGPTNGRNAAPGTIRGTYCMSFQENIVHASDSKEAAEVELKRFFRDDEIIEWKQATFPYLYAADEF